MARGKKTGGRDFQPGQSGNPAGGPKTPEDLKEARKLTKLEFERIVNQYLFEKEIDLQELRTRPGTRMIDLLIASIMDKALVHGDDRRLTFLLDRLIGKVKDHVEVETKAGVLLAYSPAQIAKGSQD